MWNCRSSRARGLTSRRTGFACGLLVALAVVGMPQSAARAQPAFGVIGGLGRASFGGSGAIDVTSRTAFLVGLVGDLPVAESFSIRPEFQLSAKGAEVRTEVGDPSEGPIKSFALHYIQIPVLAQLRTAPGSSLRPHLFGGLTVGALLGCSLGAAACGDIEDFEHRTLDVGVLVGAEFGWRRAGFGVRYEAGVRAFEASRPGNEINNGVLSFTARYMFSG